MHTRLIVFTALVTVAAGGAGVSVSAAAKGKTRTVKATDSDRWSPRSLTARKGDTIRFTWKTAAPHNVRKTSGRGSVKGGARIRSTGSATFKVPAKGTYRFICDVHPVTMKFTLRAR